MKWGLWFLLLSRKQYSRGGILRFNIRNYPQIIIYIVINFTVFLIFKYLITGLLFEPKVLTQAVISSINISARCWLVSIPRFIYNFRISFCLKQNNAVKILCCAHINISRIFFFSFSGQHGILVLIVYGQ